MNKETSGSDTLTFPAMFGRMLTNNGNAKALSFIDGEAITYAEVDGRISALRVMLEQLEIHPGDRVAILSNNMPNWGIAYFAITFMGAIAVPLLPDFLPGEIENILNHSG